MQLQSKTVAPALRALLERFIDYAGVFPPAALTLDIALDNYARYREDDHSWMLRWFVVGAAELGRVPDRMNGLLAVLAEADEPRAATIESKRLVKAEHPVYWEVALTSLQELDAVRQSGCFAKIRTGGLKPEAIPSAADVTSFIIACAERRLPFKATAGLHHPLRAEQALTYENNAPRAVMHGFVNVLMAAAFAWHGERQIEPIISEMDPSAFKFDDRAHWRDLSLDTAQVREARQKFMHSVGTCSFEEPVQDLKGLGLI